MVPVLVDEKGVELEGVAEGYLCIKQTWPSAIRTIYGDQERYETTYFAPFPGYYFTGDGARRDEDGYFWITGRVDDVINVSGHRIGELLWYCALRHCLMLRAHSTPCTAHP